MVIFYMLFIITKKKAVKDRISDWTQKLKQSPLKHKAQNRVPLARA